MPAEQADKRAAGNNGRVNRYVLIIGGIIFLILTIIIIAQNWLVPNHIRKKFEKGLSAFCEGPVEIDSVKVNHSGRVFLDGIRFYDKSQRQWMFAGKAEAVFADWPRIRPIVREIEFDKLYVHILYADGKFVLPLIPPFQQLSGPNKRADIHKFVIKDAVITIEDTQDSKLVYDNLALSALRKDGDYEFSLKRLRSDKLETLLANGIVNIQDSDFDISLQMKHQFTKAEMTLLFAALNKPQVSAQGLVSADLTMSGSLKELSGLQAKGIIDINECVLFIRDKVFANNLVAAIKLDGQRLNCDKFSAAVCNGRADGSLFIGAEQNQLVEYHGSFFGHEMSLVELTSVLAEPGRKANKGLVTLNYNFVSKGGGLQNLTGEGRVFLDDADITVFPVIPFLFKAMGLATLDPLKMSDAECTFTMTGPVATIESAHIANPFAAVEFEPGGTINLQTGQIEMYAVAVPLKQVEDIVRLVPFLDAFLNLKNKLTRFYIRGHWSSPPAKLITKTPIKDIKEGTIGFVEDVVRNGGQLGSGLLKGFGSLIPAGQSKNK
jgi:hypothetical protein